MKRERLEAIANRLRGSLWFIPAVMTVAAVVLAALTIWFDARSSWGQQQFWFLVGSGAEGARGVLSTIAGSIITVTGVVFSITIVALQLASTQYTPRVLRAFTEDRPTQLVLGVFISTFVYALLILRAVRSEMEDFDRFVPGISVTVAMGLALGSIAALIFFVNHIARSIRVEVIVERIATDVIDRIDAVFPEPFVDLEDSGVAATSSPSGGWRVRAPVTGYLQRVDRKALLHLAEAEDLVVTLTHPVGSFLIEGDTLAWVSPAPRAPAVEMAIRQSLQLGFERTLDQDLSRGIIELTDIALRALSPGINDPTTAIQCIDRLTQIVLALADRGCGSPLVKAADGRVRLVVVPVTFEEMIHLAYGQLRHSGVAHPAVAERLIQSLRRAIERAPPTRVPPLVKELEELLTAIRESLNSVADLARLEHAASGTRGEEFR